MESFPAEAEKVPGRPPPFLSQDKQKAAATQSTTKPVRTRFVNLADMGRGNAAPLRQ